MTSTPARHRPPTGLIADDDTPATGVSPGPAGRAALGRATGILMALVPCSTATARRILAETARVAGVGLSEAVGAALALRDGEDGPPSPVETILQTVIEHTLHTPDPAPAALQPNPSVLRGHLRHFRALRRRTFATPEDPGLRCELEDASYTLCVLTGRRSPHHAVHAAEELVALHRLDTPHAH
ncbi:DUF5133 domain-containing protein [Streptomyces sp. NPDC044571]|uniref:DUF5133 domain-containing protein n=1 Tax=Streptomyces sp. NPDC044571 TaxID=3155371 RepID=UPI0033FCF881